MPIPAVNKANRKLDVMHSESAEILNDKNWGLQWKISCLLMAATPLAPQKSSPKEAERLSAWMEHDVREP